MPESPAGNVHRFPRRNPRLVDALQLTLDVPGLSEPSRREINRLLTGLVAEPLRIWNFVMVAAVEDTLATLLHGIASGPRGFTVLRVYSALPCYIRRDTGELICSQRTMGKTAGVVPGDVSRAYARLVELGVLLREEKGKYRIHPTLMWKGELGKRTEAEKAAPQLTLVPLDDSPPAA